MVRDPSKKEATRSKDQKGAGLSVFSNGECGKEQKMLVQARWKRWRKVSGVTCDKGVSGRMKEIHKRRW